MGTTTVTRSTVPSAREFRGDAQGEGGLARAGWPPAGSHAVWRSGSGPNARLCQPRKAPVREPELPAPVGLLLIEMDSNRNRIRASGS